MVSPLGNAVCWGSGVYGILSEQSAVPVTVPGFSANVDKVAVAQTFACAALVTSQVQCWYGLLNNIYSRLWQVLPPSLKLSRMFYLLCFLNFS